MPIKTYLWIEDRKGKSGYMFWKELMHQLYPDVVVESKKNNSELVKAVGTLQDSESKYIVVFDNSFDNLQVYQEYRLLKKYADKRSNVHLLDIICFEYILLEFDRLIDWIYAPYDEFRTKRSGVIRAREILIEMIQTGEVHYKEIREIMLYDEKLEEHNIEQLSAKMLFDLTRNTGFEVSKKAIGDCWISSCCEWTKRREDDICGLDTDRLSVADKMMCIYMGTSLANEFSQIGMEVKM